MSETGSRPGVDAVHVLHVDDSVEFAELAAEYLEREDDRFVVETAESADAGLDRLAAGPVDCVVSDYEMPGIDGIEFLDAVRERYPDLPFILFTGKGSEGIASEAISAGVTDYLRKDGGTDQYAILANRIDNAVARERTERALEERKRHLETLIQNLPGMVYRCRNEPGWPMTVVEGECAELTGYDAAALERGDVNWGEDVIHPADRTAVWEAVQSATAAGDSFEETYRIVTADGETRWVWERGRALDLEGSEETYLEGFVTDVTARENGRAELERTNALRSTLLDALPAGVVAEDENRKVMTINRRAFELFDAEYSPSAFEGLDCRGLADAVKDRFVDPAGFVERVDRLVTEGGDCSAELDLVDGRTLQQVHRTIDLPDGEGHLWLYRDVTDRSEREHELERYEGIVQASGDPVYTLDAEGRFTFVNDTLLETVGYGDPADLLGEHVSVVAAEDGAVERAEEEIRSLLSSDRSRATVEFDIVTADGERIPCEVNISVLPFEESFRGTVGVVRDVSERVERARKLERLRERAQALMYTETAEETARVATAAADEIIGAPLSGVFLVDDAGEALEPAAFMDTSADAFDEIPRFERGGDPGSRAAVVWEAFEAGEPVRFDDTRAAGELTEHSPALTAVVHPLGDHGVLIVSSDEPNAFTETDESLIELLSTSLEAGLDRVRREGELREQRDELKRRNQRLDQFSSVVSHDLRNPLNVAEGYLEMAREERDDEHLAAVARAHDRMRALIDDLLALARVDGDRDDERLALDEVAEECWRNVDTDGAALKCRTDRTVTATRGGLMRLFENLFRNAVEHAGEVTVTVGDLPDGFYVADDGPGIPEADRERVFEPGYSTAESGTGFGLPIVRSICAEHGWSVRAVAGEDGGARFEITGVDDSDADP